MKSKSVVRVGVVGLSAVLCLLTLASIPMLAQVEGEEQATLTLQDVKDRLKENKKHLEEARSRGKAGDTAGVETAIENYDRGMTSLNRALAAGRFEGDEAQREQALERVEKATRKNGEVLSDLLNKVPEQAQPGIERALANSQKGRATAMENLQRLRAERQERVATRERREMGQPGTYGRPEGTGRSRGTAGPPSGIGGAGGAGRPSGGVGGGRGPRP